MSVSMSMGTGADGGRTGMLVDQRQHEVEELEESQSLAQFFGARMGARSGATSAPPSSSSPSPRIRSSSAHQREPQSHGDGDESLLGSFVQSRMDQKMKADHGGGGEGDDVAAAPISSPSHQANRQQHRKQQRRRSALATVPASQSQSAEKHVHHDRHHHHTEGARSPARASPRYARRNSASASLPTSTSHASPISTRSPKVGKFHGLRSPKSAPSRRKGLPPSSPTTATASVQRSPRSIVKPKLPFNSDHETASEHTRNNGGGGSSSNSSRHRRSNRNKHNSPTSNAAPTPTPTGDSAVSRQPMEGFRGGKRWNIMEDTPAGHAEKLSLVVAVEFDDDSSESDSNSAANEPPSLDEDSDIEEEDSNRHASAVATTPALHDGQQQEQHYEHSEHDESQSINDQVRTNSRTMSLPTDPVDASLSHTRLARRGSMDRFAPSFINNDMWTTDDDITVEKREGKLNRTLSGDVSILTESELTNSIQAKDRKDAFTHASSINRQNQQNSGDQSTLDRTRTPVTMRQSGGRRPSRKDEMVERFTIDIDDRESSKTDNYEENHDGSYDNHDEDNTATGDFEQDEEQPLRDTSCSPAKDKRRLSRRAASNHSPRHHHKSSPRSPSRKQHRRLQSQSKQKQQDDSKRKHARNSPRESSRKERSQYITKGAKRGIRSSRQSKAVVEDGLHRNQHRQYHNSNSTASTDDDVPSTPIAVISMVASQHRSPMSSSFTSTPNSRSIVSSGRQQSRKTAQSDAPALQQEHIKEEHEYSDDDDDDNHDGNDENEDSQSSSDDDDHDHDEDSSADGYTLGASTITTNFSTTQRTRGDNTVSTRSLFSPSERLRVSETPKIPLRRKDEWGEGTNVTDEHQANPNTLGQALERARNRRERPHVRDDRNGSLKMVLRKPSVDEDSIEKNKMAVGVDASGRNMGDGDGSVSEASSVNSTQLRDRCDIGQHKTDATEGACLQLNIRADGVHVNTIAAANQPPTATIESHLDQTIQSTNNNTSNNNDSIQSRSTSSTMANTNKDDPFDGMQTDDFDSVTDALHRKKRKNKLNIFKKSLWRGNKGSIPLEDEGSSAELN